MNEMSFESLMAVGTGLASPESKESKINGVPFDGYNDGVDMDLARTSEQLHFVDTYDKLQSLHSAEKLKMIKKISTAYNVKTIGNANVANSVESFCNNAMSLEGVDVKAVAAKIKAKFIEIFKKIAEFFKNMITKIMTAKYKGQVADNIKKLLNMIHMTLNDVIKQVSTTPRSDDKLQAELSLKQTAFNTMRSNLIDVLSCYSFAAKAAKKLNIADKKATIDDVVDTDMIEKVSKEIAAIKGDVSKTENLITEILNMKVVKTVNAEGVESNDDSALKAKIDELNKASENIKKAKEELSKKVKAAKEEAKDKGKADKAAAATPAPAAAGQNA